MENMEKIKELTGVCRYCGQTRIVKAADQESADDAATLDCGCPGGELERTKKHIKERLDELIGETAPDNDWTAVSLKAYEAVISAAYCIAEGEIQTCAMRVDGTNLKIARKGDKISIVRSKTVSQGGSIEK